MSTKVKKPTLEDLVELSGIDVLHPGGLEITKRIGEIVNMEDQKVLDVACGRGTLLCYYAKDHKIKIIGVDLNSKMIESAIKRAVKEKVRDLIDFKVGDALDLPFNDNTFDIVINEGGVEVTSDPQKCLNEMTRVTKLGGYVVVHDNIWLTNMAEKEKIDIIGRLGAIPYTLFEWKEMMQRAGLTNIWTEDWSGLENVYKIRHDRKVKSLDGMLSLKEKIFNIYPKIITRYGIKGIFYAYESLRIIEPLYSEGKLGYYLTKGQKL